MGFISDSINRIQQAVSLMQAGQRLQGLGPIPSAFADPEQDPRCKRDLQFARRPNGFQPRPGRLGRRIPVAQ